jgi:DNA adenine methylase
MTDQVKPFLKWPGGKRWLAPHIRDVLEGRSFKRYFEPFLGGGAVYFALQPKRAFLSDINEDLINTYQQVQSKAVDLQNELRNIPVNRETYLALRDASPESNIDRAVRFLYLNRTAFGGMYRLNGQGRFNVPFGGGQRTPELLWRDHLLTRAASILQEATVTSLDFEAALADAREGDLVYCDPTYTTAHNRNGFTRYNERNFTWSDQQRLASVCHETATKGATVIVSNVASVTISVLYPGARILTLERKSLISPNPSKRQVTAEYLICLNG